MITSIGSRCPSNSYCAAIVLLVTIAASAAHADVPNDDCISAEIVTDGTPAFEGGNAGANVTDDGSAACVPSSGDVWFEYVATCSGTATVDTFGSVQLDTVLSAYDACGGSELACDDDTAGTLSQISLGVTSGQSVWIRLASVNSPGDYDLNITCSETPANDDCASATLATDGAPALEGDNSGASDTDDAEATCRDSDHDVWFEYVATCNGMATVDTFGSAQLDTVLSVYGDCSGGEIACNDDTDGTLSEVVFGAMSGQSYWIRLASIGVPGDYTDYNISVGKDGFSFMITSTDLDDAGPDALDNDDIKFVIGYSLDIEL